jgi:RHS repeat-associated protein
VSFGYDPILRLSSIQSGGATTTFGYDGIDLVAENDGSGNVLRRYVHGPDVDEPLVWYEGSGTGTADRRYLHADERGSIVSVTDGAGKTLGINRYDEYGAPAPQNIGRFQYTGQKWLSEAGLYDYKARAYDAVSGRFVQPDPIDYDGGPNLYAYVGGDPINIVDSLGTGGPPPAPDCPDVDGDGKCDPTITINGKRPKNKKADDAPIDVVQWLAFTLDSFAEKHLKPPVPRRPDETKQQCKARVAGNTARKVGAGAAGVALGGPWVPYPRMGFAGGGGGTSIISTLTRGLFGRNLRMSFQIAGTSSVGGAIGRVVSRVSVIGGAALAGWSAGKAIGAEKICSK